MPVALGFKGVVGFGTEATYGTPVASSKFIPLVSESLAMTEERIISSHLRGFQPRVWVAGNRAIDGDIEVEALYQGQELLWKLFFGAVTTTGLEAGGTGAYQHVFLPATSIGTSLTVNVGRDINNHQFHGCKIESFTLTAAINDFLRCTFTIMGEDEGTTAVETATYPTIVPVDFTQVGILTIGGSSFNISAFSLTATNGLAADRRFMGSKLRKEPLRNAIMEVTCDATIEYDAATLHDKFVAGSEVALQLKAQGGLIIGTTYYVFQLDSTRTVLESWSAPVAGPEIIQQALTMRGFYDVAATLDMLKLTLVGSTGSV